MFIETSSSHIMRLHVLVGINAYMWMWVFKAHNPKEEPAFYQCPITISVVSNVTNVMQHVSNDVARTAAASIALQGRWAGTKIYQFERSVSSIRLG